MNYKTIINDKYSEMEFTSEFDKLYLSKKKQINIDCIELSENSFSIIINGRSHILTIYRQIDGYQVIVDHNIFFIKVLDELDILLEKFGMESNLTEHLGEVHALIPGLVSNIFVKEGDEVELGQKLIILEAMKMENEIISPIAGEIKQIHIHTGDKVEKGDLILEIIS